MQRSFLVAVLLCAFVGVGGGSVARLVQSPDGGVELTPGVPTQLSPYQLRTYAEVARRDLFWLGPMPGTKLEVTEAGSKGLFVRYVPTGKAIGDRQSRYATIATYLVEGAYRVARDSGRTRGAVTETLPAGGLAVWRRDRPTSVFLAYPGSATLIEIFAPDGADARRLARSGFVRSLG